QPLGPSRCSKPWTKPAIAASAGTRAARSVEPEGAIAIMRIVTSRAAAPERRLVVMEDGVVAATLEVVAIAEVSALLAQALDGEPFHAEELAYARARRDPERRLAARLAAKRAVARLLGEGFEARDAFVQRGRGGPPRLVLS